MGKSRKSTTPAVDPTRRNFLKVAMSAPVLGLGVSPAAALMNAILGGISQKAWADSQGITQSRKYVRLTRSGGPYHSMTNAFPYSGNFTRSPNVITEFALKDGRYTQGDQVSYDSGQKGVQIPAFLNQDLPTSDGLYKNIKTALLPDYFEILGVTTENAGHGGSQMRSFQLPGQKESSMAMAADNLNLPFAALNLNAAGFTWVSTKNKSFTTLGTGGANPVQGLLSPFNRASTAQFNQEVDGLKAAFSQVGPLLDRHATLGNVGAKAVFESRTAAMQLFDSKIGALYTQYPAILSKYQTLISRSMYDPNKPIPNINDAPIGHGGSGPAALYQLDGNMAFPLELASDVRSAIDGQTTVSNLAPVFAIAEFVLANNLCGSIAGDLGNFTGAILPTTGARAGGMTNDQHQTGFFPLFYFNFLAWRAIYSCILELKTKMEEKGDWGSTLIHLQADFNRNPRTDLTGADHGWEGCSAKFFGGGFNGPLIIGNPTSKDSRGSWGKGGAVAALGGKPVRLLDTAIALSALLGVQAPFTSSTSIVTLGSGGLVSNIEPSTWV